MSIKLICKPEFFNSRLKSHLDLNITTEPGTTYFLCDSLEEVHTLASSHDAASLTSLPVQQKVLICKPLLSDTKTTGQTVSQEINKSTSVYDENFHCPALKDEKKDDVNLVRVNSTFDKQTQHCQAIKLAPEIKVEAADTKVEVKDDVNQIRVTSTSDKHTQHYNETKLAPKIKVVTPGNNVLVNRLSSFTPGCPVTIQGDSSHVTIVTTKLNGDKAHTSRTMIEKPSSLPCRSLRQELKQAILQRRMDQGKKMIDLAKEEDERKAVVQSIKMSEEEMEKMVKRRVSNNRAARKCREKRKMEEDNLMQEAKKLKERKNKLNEMISTLEQQQKNLRLYVTGAKGVDKDSEAMLSSILYSEVKIPELPPRTIIRWDSDLSNSMILSGSEYNSDDTRNGFELDSSQETNDTRDSTSVNYARTEDRGTTGENVNENFSGTKCKDSDNDRRNFKGIEDTSDRVDLHDDSDVELIEFDRPLVIDIS